MEPYYVLLFGVAAVLAGGLEYGNRMAKGATQATSTDFVRFKNNYLVVYSLMMGEWWRSLICPRRRDRPHMWLHVAASLPPCASSIPWSSCATLHPRSHVSFRLCVKPQSRRPYACSSYLCAAPLPLQLGTGSKARMCTPCTSTTASRLATLAGSSSRALGRP